MIRITNSLMALSAMTLGIHLLTTPVSAEGNTSAQCAETYAQCQAECSLNHKNDNTEFGPCMTLCSGKYAACDASAVIEKAKPWVDEKVKEAKPWLEEQAEKAKKLYDDLMKTYNPDDAPESPQKKTRDNSI